MQPLLVLPLLAFLILLALFILVLRRAGRFIAATRDVERFRRQVGDLAGRVETSLGEICGRVDAVRRGQLGADSSADDLDGVARRRRTLRGRGARRSTRPRDGRPDPGRDRRRARAGRPGPRDDRARPVDPGLGPVRRARDRGPDRDQARLPQRAPRPRGDRPPGEARAATCRRPTTASRFQRPERLTVRTRAGRRWTPAM